MNDMNLHDYFNNCSERQALSKCINMITEIYEFLEKPNEFHDAICYIRDRQIEILKTVKIN